MRGETSRLHIQKEDGHADEPSALIFPVPSLHDFVFSRQYLLLKDLSATPLVYPGDLEDLRRVHEGVRAASHHRDASYHTFVDLNARSLECAKLACKRNNTSMDAFKEALTWTEE